MNTDYLRYIVGLDLQKYIAIKSLKKFFFIINMSESDFLLIIFLIFFKRTYIG